MDEKRVNPLIKAIHHFLLSIWALFALFPLVWMVIMDGAKLLYFAIADGRLAHRSMIDQPIA